MSLPKIIEGVSLSDFITHIHLTPSTRATLMESINGRINNAYFKIKTLPDIKDIGPTFQNIGDLYKKYVIPHYDETGFSYDPEVEAYISLVPSEKLVNFWEHFRKEMNQWPYDGREIVFLSIMQTVPIVLYQSWRNFSRNDAHLENPFLKAFIPLSDDILRIKRSHQKRRR